jgi:hypothetical protein
MAEFGPKVTGDEIAPGFGTFATAEVPDLRDSFPHARDWLADYYRDAVWSRFEEGQRPLVLAFLRRAQHAFDAYHSARELTSAFLEIRGADSSVAAYYAALSDWEWFSVDYAMAVDVYRHLFGPLFEKGDGSPAYRLYTVANNVKHTSNSLEAHPEAFPAVPLWLSDSGLESYEGVSVSYVEASGLLSEMARIADELVHTRHASSSI